MKYIKTKTDKKLIIAAILAGTLALLIGAYFIISGVIKNKKPDDNGGGSNPALENLLDCESSHYGVPVAYPVVSSSAMTHINVVDMNGELFSIMRFDYFNNNFIFAYDKNGDGKCESDEFYMPDIVYDDSFFDYQTLYAYDTTSGTVSSPKITYICTAVGALYYDERIKLSDDAEERAEQLAIYGLDGYKNDGCTSIEFFYNTYDSEGKVASENNKYKLYIGDKVVTDTSYYFIIEGREDYVYATRTPYFDYAIKGFESFLHSTLVASGLQGDSTYGPILTPNYSQWKNTVYYYRTLDDGSVEFYTMKDGKEISVSENPYTVPAGADVVGNASYVLPVDIVAGDYIELDKDGNQILTEDMKDGYIAGESGDITFDLGNMKGNKDFIYAVQALVGKELGKYEQSFSFTLPDENKSVDYGNGRYVKYSYKIVAIESVLNENGEQAAAGCQIEPTDTVKVMYFYEITYADGTKKGNINATDYPAHALIDLSAASEIPGSAISAIEASTTGELDEPITFDVVYDKPLIDIKVTELLSVLGENDAWIDTEGTKITSKDKAKVRCEYKAYVFGVEKTGGLDIILDLSKSMPITNESLEAIASAVGISAEEVVAEKNDTAQLKKAIVGSKLGDELTPVEFDITYKKTGAITTQRRLVIDDILEIYSKNGLTAVTTVAEDSVVVFSYYLSENGTRVGDVEKIYLPLSKIVEGSELYDYEVYKPFKDALIGHKAGFDANIVINEGFVSYQPLVRFAEYTVGELKRFITHSPVVSFSYIDTPDRDPFYGGSIYENELEGSPYALEESSCQAVVSLLGGLRDEATSATGYGGFETVAVGITPEIMDRYGLYYNKIYFELPRELDLDSEERWFWYESLCFELYISEVNYFDEDGNPVEPFRYIGSNLYDIVAKAPASDFEFLEQSFLELWARRTLLLVDVTEIESFEIEFNLEELKGKYEFITYIENVYTDSEGNVTTVKPEGNYDVKEIMDLQVLLRGEPESYTDSLLYDYYFADYSERGIFYSDFFTHTSGVANVGGEFAGTASYKEFMRMLYSMHYNGFFDGAERDRIYDSVKNTPPHISMKITVGGNSHGIDFYRVDDRRVMVSIYDVDGDGNRQNEGHDFYISTFAFKKIANNAILMLNGKAVDGDVAYPLG